MLLRNPSPDVSQLQDQPPALQLRKDSATVKMGLDQPSRTNGNRMLPVIQERDELITITWVVNVASSDLVKHGQMLSIKGLKLTPELIGHCF